MKLQPTFTFAPTSTYLFSFKDSNATVCLEEPVYDPEFNIVNGNRIALDGCDKDGDYEGTVDCCRSMERIGGEKVSIFIELRTNHLAASKLDGHCAVEENLVRANNLGIIKEMPVDMEYGERKPVMASRPRPTTSLGKIEAPGS